MHTDRIRKPVLGQVGYLVRGLIIGLVAANHWPRCTPGGSPAGWSGRLSKDD